MTSCMFSISDWLALVCCPWSFFKTVDLRAAATWQIQDVQLVTQQKHVSQHVCYIFQVTNEVVHDVAIIFVSQEGKS